MTADAFIGWLHDLRYSRMVCMLLPTDAVMAYPIPVVRSGERMLVVPFFEVAADEAYRPYGFIAVPYGGERIVAYSAAPWLESVGAETLRLYSGNAQQMDAYYVRLAKWEAPDKAQCAELQSALLDMLKPDLAGFYRSIISER